MCIALDAFFEAGGYNPRVALDYADLSSRGACLLCIRNFVYLTWSCLQDFSNEEQRLEPLAARFRLYLSSAVEVTTYNWKDRLRLAYQIGKHTLALTIRTRSLCFLNMLCMQLIRGRA